MVDRLRERHQHRQGLPLRLRVVLTFALTAVVITGVLSVVTWILCSSYMLAQRERSAENQAHVYARLVDDGAVTNDRTALGELLGGLDADVPSAVLDASTGTAQTSPSFPDIELLPESLFQASRDHQFAHARINTDSFDVTAVTVPLSKASLSYVAVFSMKEVERNIHFLAWMLAAGVLLSALAGVLLGRWAASRSLRPLVELTRVAGVAAGGDLSVRLPATRDPDLRLLVDAFNETAGDLERRVEQDARFASDVSHELRSPLTTMLNAMSVLRHRRDDMTPAARQAVDLLHEDLNRFLTLVNDLLDLSVTREGADRMSLEHVDLAVLVQEAIRAHYPQLLTLVRVPNEPVPVSADRRRVERALANLVDNAIRHGGGVVGIAVLTTESGCHVEVDDAGSGIPPEYRQRIFERFTRGTQFGLPRSEIGSGLGLAIVADNLRMHGGWASVTDHPGGGSRFVLSLPRGSSYSAVARGGVQDSVGD